MWGLLLHLGNRSSWIVYEKSKNNFSGLECSGIEWWVEKGMGGKEIWWATRDWGIFFLIRMWKVLKLMERTVERFFKRADDNLLVLIPKWNQKMTRGLQRSWQRERIRVFAPWQKRNEKRKKWVNIPRRNENSNGESWENYFLKTYFSGRPYWPSTICFIFQKSPVLLL